MWRGCRSAPRFTRSGPRWPRCEAFPGATTTTPASWRLQMVSFLLAHTHTCTKTHNTEIQSPPFPFLPCCLSLCPLLSQSACQTGTSCRLTLLRCYGNTEPPRSVFGGLFRRFLQSMHWQSGRPVRICSCHPSIVIHPSELKCCRELFSNILIR